MTAHRIVHPLRHASDPQAKVEACRAKVERLRRDVLARRAGASSLATAEYELHRALDRLAESDGPDDPPEAA